MKSIRLHIDRIVVDGVGSSGRSEFASALESQLREWAEGGMDEEFPGNQRKRIGSLNAGQMRPGATPTQAAARVVDTIKGSFGKGPSDKAPSTKRWKHV